MKVNRSHYQPWIDPNGGEWIHMVAGKFKDTIWRPANMRLDENDRVTFDCEFFGDVNEDYMFAKVANAIIQDQLTMIAAQDQQLVDSFEGPDGD